MFENVLAAMNDFAAAVVNTIFCPFPVAAAVLSFSKVNEFVLEYVNNAWHKIEVVNFFVSFLISSNQKIINDRKRR